MKFREIVTMFREGPYLVISTLKAVWLAKHLKAICQWLTRWWTHYVERPFQDSVLNGFWIVKVLVGTFKKENVNEYCSCKIPFTALVTNTTTLDISISDKHTKHNNLTSTSYTCIECLPKLCLATASTTNFLAQSWRTSTGQTLIIWPHTKLPPRSFQ